MIKKHILIIGLLFKLFVINAQKNDFPNPKYLNEKIESIEVDVNYSNGDWTPVLEKAKNKRIILLGELNHGAKEIFLSRNDLIKSLHKKLGFNVILFESGIGEMISVNSQKEILTPTEMTYGFFSGWRTKEFVELMDYVKSNNISIHGFDVQKTGGTFENILITELKKTQQNSDRFSDIEQRFSEQKRKLTHRKAVFDSLQTSTKELISDYTKLKLLLESSGNSDVNSSSYLIVKTILNRIEYLKYFLDFTKDKDWNKRWRARDFMMYSNVDWFLKNTYENQKVIVVGHNFHISKYNEKEEVMGEFLKKEYDSEMYAIGVFAGNGSFLNNRGLEEQLKPVSNEGLDIKQIINQSKYQVGFLNIPSKKDKNSDWLFNDIIINDTFINLSSSNKMILSNSFDGLIFIDTISPPEKNKNHR